MSVNTKAEYWNFRFNEEQHIRQINQEEELWRAGRPSTVYKPTLSVDGKQWCALYGDDLQTGVAGFGNSPEKAMTDFDRQWIKEIADGETTQ